MAAQPPPSGYLDQSRTTTLPRSLPRNAAVFDNSPIRAASRGHLFDFSSTFISLVGSFKSSSICGVNVCARAGTTFYSPLLFTSVTFATRFFRQPLLSEAMAAFSLDEKVCLRNCYFYHAVAIIKVHFTNACTQRFVLAEMIKCSSVDVEMLIRFVESNVSDPNWMIMQIPSGTVNQMMLHFNDASFLIRLFLRYINFLT